MRSHSSILVSLLTLAFLLLCFTPPGLAGSARAASAMTPSTGAPAAVQVQRMASDRLSDQGARTLQGADVLPNAEVATILTSNVPIVVERPIYNGPANLGLATSGSVLFGRNGGGLTWAFPGGSTAGGNQSQIFLFNLGLKAVTIHASFSTDSPERWPSETSPWRPTAIRY